MKKLAIITFLAVMVIASAASAQLPKTINYQGVLTDNGGTVVADGSYSLTFRLYTVPTGGAPFWICTEPVTVTKGIFSAVLGKTFALTSSFDAQYYLGISVAGGAELVPRSALTASAYSLNSLAVTGTDNIFPSTGNVGIGTTSPAGKLEIHYDNLLANNAAIRIDNNISGGQDLISFAFNDLQQASLRKANGGNFYVSSSNGLTFQTNYINRMRILAAGNVGIGLTTPVELLDVNGGIKLGTSSGTNAGTMRWSGTDFEGYDGSSWQSLTSGGSTLPSGTSGQTLRHNGTDWTASSLLTNSGMSIRVGSLTQNGYLRVYQNGAAGDIAEFTQDGTDGGAMNISDRSGNIICSINNDSSGEGGYFYVNRATSYAGFTVDGNYGNSNDPRVSITGATSSAVFDMSTTGNNSVALPADAVSNSEILDEPGVASNGENASTLIGADPTVILSRSITVPASGYVLVMSSCQLTLIHSTGTASRAELGVSDNNTSFPYNQDIMAGLPGGAASGTYYIPVTTHGLFTVASAGTYTYYFLGDLFDAAANFRSWDPQLTLVYIPTAYGSVVTPLAGSGSSSEDGSGGNPGMTAAELAAERSASIADNDARVQRELSEMRAEIDALKREMEENKE